jgi:hypothetical protein
MKCVNFRSVRTLKHRPKRPSTAGWALFGLGTVLVGAFLLLLSASTAKRRKGPVYHY